VSSPTAARKRLSVGGAWINGCGLWATYRLWAILLRHSLARPAFSRPPCGVSEQHYIMDTAKANRSVPQPRPNGFAFRSQSPPSVSLVNRGTKMRDTSLPGIRTRAIPPAPDMPWLIEQTPRLRQELLVRQAQAVRPPVRPLGRERPLTVNVGTALRSFYADVLKEPLPPELARLARALQDRDG
jgi:hypothetical protein